MKTIINIKTCKEESVPDDYIECSVCGEYHPPASYRKEGEAHQSRTNCASCYEASSETWKNLEDFVARQKDSDKYKLTVRVLKLKKTYLENSIPVEDMIAALQALPEGSRLVMNHEGYYAAGPLANIFLPEHDSTFGESCYYSIGNSSQHY